MTENTMIVCTENGYYYTTGKGRYGRITGLKASAETLCQKHADDVVEMLIAVGLRARTEQVATRGCMVCQRKTHQ